MKSPSSEVEFDSLFTQAEVFRQEGDFHLAMDSYQELLFYRLGKASESLTEFTEVDAIVIERLADLSWLMDYTKIAGNLLTGLDKLFIEADNQFAHIYVMIKRVQLALDCNELDQAKKLLDQLAPFWGPLEDINLDQLELWEKQINLPINQPGQESMLLSRLYFVLGLMLARLGQYIPAINCLTRLLEICDNKRDVHLQSLLIPARLTRISFFLEQGNIKKAVDELGKIDGGVIKKSNPASNTQYLELLAKTSLMTGQLGKCKRKYLEVYEYCISNQFRNGAIHSLLNLANVLIYLNQVSYAKSLLDQAQKLIILPADQILQAKISVLKDLLLNRAAPYTKGRTVIPTLTEIRNKPSKQNNGSQLSETELPPVIPEIDQTIGYLNYFEDKELNFRFLLNDLQFEEAREYLKEMTSHFSFSDSVLIQNRMKVNSFLLEYFTASDKWTSQDFEETLVYFEKQELIPELWQLYRLFSWTDKENNADWTERADLLLSTMLNSLNSEEQAIYLLNKWSAEEEAFAVEINKILVLRSKAKLKNPLIRIKSKLELLTSLDKFRYRIEKYRDDQAAKQLGNTQQIVFKTRESWVGKLLFSSKDRIWISFMALPDRIVILYWGYLLSGIEIVSLSRIQLRELVKEWHTKATPYGLNRDRLPISKNTEEIIENANALSEHLAGALCLPELISRLPSRIRRISFLPDDALNGFPFGGLRINGKYLAESFSISLPYSTISPRREKINKNRNNKNALLIGISEGSSNFPPLPGVSNEIRQLDQVIKPLGYEVKKLLNQSAGLKEIYHSIETGVDLLHFACHGGFQYDSPTETGLMLLNNEIFSLKDISTVSNLKNVTFVSLSSCWAADQYILPGRWVISLPETFIRAGVDTVLGCMWQVNDDVAVSFMRKFYEYSSVYPKDVALRKTQLDTLQNKLGVIDLDTSNPFFWAGYTLYGRVV